MCVAEQAPCCWGALNHSYRHEEATPSFPVNTRTAGTWERRKAFHQTIQEEVGHEGGLQNSSWYCWLGSFWENGNPGCDFCGGRLIFVLKVQAVQGRVDKVQIQCSRRLCLPCTVNCIAINLIRCHKELCGTVPDTFCHISSKLQTSG